MVPRWAVVDKLVHELGSLRATVQQVEAEPTLAEADVTLELRRSLARAADTIHLVIGGNDAMVTQAWRTIAEAQEVGSRARQAIESSRSVHEHSRSIRDRVKAQMRNTGRQIDDLQAIHNASEAKRGLKKETKRAN